MEESEFSAHRVLRILTKWLVRALAFLLAAALLWLGWYWVARPQPTAPTEIFRGVTYSCEPVPQSPEGTGLMYLVEVDLAAPGIGLYTTPVDPEAVSRGCHYRLRWPQAVVKEKGLAVAVTGPIFQFEDPSRQWPGALAKAVDTVVSDRQVNRVHPHSYLLWFEEDLTPHLEKTKPPRPEALARASWGVGGQAVLISDGVVSSWTAHKPDAQVMVGIDAGRRRLYLAAFDYASQDVAVRMLAERGAKEAVSLDSGESACMVIGAGAAGGPARSPRFARRGVATILGVRAITVDNTRQ